MDSLVVLLPAFMNKLSFTKLDKLQRQVQHKVYFLASSQSQEQYLTLYLDMVRQKIDSNAILLLEQKMDLITNEAIVKVLNQTGQIPIFMTNTQDKMKKINKIIQHPQEPHRAQLSLQRLKKLHKESQERISRFTNEGKNILELVQKQKQRKNKIRQQQIVQIREKSKRIARKSINDRKELVQKKIRQKTEIQQKNKQLQRRIKQINPINIQQAFKNHIKKQQYQERLRYQKALNQRKKIINNSFATQNSLFHKDNQSNRSNNSINQFTNTRRYYRGSMHQLLFKQNQQKEKLQQQYNQAKKQRIQTAKQYSNKIRKSLPLVPFIPSGKFPQIKQEEQRIQKEQNYRSKLIKLGNQYNKAARSFKSATQKKKVESPPPQKKYINYLRENNSQIKHHQFKIKNSKKNINKLIYDSHLIDHKLNRITKQIYHYNSKFKQEARQQFNKLLDQAMQTKFYLMKNML